MSGFHAWRRAQGTLHSHHQPSYSLSFVHKSQDMAAWQELALLRAKLPLRSLAGANRDCRFGLNRISIVSTCLRLFVCRYLYWSLISLRMHLVSVMGCSLACACVFVYANACMHVRRDNQLRHSKN